MEFTVIGGPSSTGLAQNIASKLDASYIDTTVRVFPDGESKITLDKEPKGGKIIVVQSTQPPVDTNVLHALSLISKARQYSPRVIAIVPYFAYMRQDMEFLPGEIVTSATIAKLFKDVGASKIISIDMHSRLALNYFEVPIKNASAVSKLAEYFVKLKLRKPLIVATDLFWSNQARQFASFLDTNYISINKQRDRRTGKIRIIPSKKLNLLKRDVILLDDMISTGGSMIKAAEYLKEQNCGTIYAACTHALLVNNAENNLKKAGIKNIVSTNTITNKYSKVDVTEIIIKEI